MKINKKQIIFIFFILLQVIFQTQEEKFPKNLMFYLKKKDLKKVFFAISIWVSHKKTVLLFDFNQLYFKKKFEYRKFVTLVAWLKLYKITSTY